MKILLFGLGSIGQRHLDNMHSLLPDAAVIVADPVMREDGERIFSNWREAVSVHYDSSCAVIASPTWMHLDQLVACVYRHDIRRVYVEKPPCAMNEIEQYEKMESYAGKWPCAVGFQYRFNPTVSIAMPIVRRNGHVEFFARDDLIGRYGRTCLETMASHPIDTACYLLGDAISVDLHTDGMSVWGEATHQHGVSVYNISMGEGPRESMLATESSDGRTRDSWELEAGNGMYRDALAAWLTWAGGGEHDERTATLADGLRVMRVMSRAQY